MKPLKNAEEQLRDLSEKEGWEVIHKGWPDFACIRDGEMMFVEVKGYKGEMLKKHQHYLMTNLAKVGLKCFKWTPNGGFEQIPPDTPFQDKDMKTPRLTIESLTKEEWEKADSLVESEHWEIFKNMKPSSQRRILSWLDQGEAVRW